MIPQALKNAIQREAQKHGYQIAEYGGLQKGAIRIVLEPIPELGKLGGTYRKSK